MIEEEMMQKIVELARRRIEGNYKITRQTFSLRGQEIAFRLDLDCGFMEGLYVSADNEIRMGSAKVGDIKISNNLFELKKFFF